jgi:hypothetical protein
VDLDPKIQEIATGSLAALSALGAVIRKRDGSVHLVPLGDKVTPLEDEGTAFSRTKTAVVDRADGGMVYWAAEAKLRRRKLSRDGSAGPVEELASGVEDGYAVAALPLPGADEKDVVAFVARAPTRDGERAARVWIDGDGAYDLSPDGTGASSVALVTRGTTITAVWLDARSALAPIHSRTIDATVKGQSRIGPETVVWIAPSPGELYATLGAVSGEHGVLAFSALPKNANDFGLAVVPVVPGKPPLESARWLDYPNGLDPAPAVGVTLCGRAGVVLARPLERAPESPRLIEFVTLGPDGTTAPDREIARGARVDHVAAWASPAGDGWIAWTADGRTRARRARCRK